MFYPVHFKVTGSKENLDSAGNHQVDVITYLSGADPG